MIYFMQPTDGGPVKIGFTDNLLARHKQLETHYGRPLAILATMEGDLETERKIHDRFSHLRFEGKRSVGRQPEQFRPGPDLMQFINRPLFVNQGDVDLMPAIDDRVVIAHIKGTPGYAAWLEGIHQKTHIPKAALFRIGLAEWASRNGHSSPPEL